MARRAHHAHSVTLQRRRARLRGAGSDACNEQDDRAWRTSARQPGEI
jgi:hypothetical protein